ncbi:MAG TPA: hypothetical protein VM847_10700 [Tahibacter sp.]|nr:hypothetical protein [Tahibacter sp.]
MSIVVIDGIAKHGIALVTARAQPEKRAWTVARREAAKQAARAPVECDRRSAESSACPVSHRAHGIAMTA